jgi:hypothetical protein
MARRKRGENTGPLPTAEELARIAGALPVPIDFAQLIAEGVLREVGGGWYEVLDYTRLPEHVRMKIAEVDTPNLARFAERDDRHSDTSA